jgi:hypothetical protein
MVTNRKAIMAAMFAIAISLVAVSVLIGCAIHIFCSV